MRTPWIDFLARDEKVRSNTSVCLKIAELAVAAQSRDAQAHFTKAIADLLGQEKAAFDIGAYRDAPPGLRIWCGPTVEAGNLEALVPWLDFAFETVKAAQ